MQSGQLPKAMSYTGHCVHGSPVPASKKYGVPHTIRTSTSTQKHEQTPRIETIAHSGGRFIMPKPISTAHSEKPQIAPNLHSQMLHDRVIWLDRPLYPETTEDVIASLTYLNKVGHGEPIYFAIDSPGIFDDEGTMVSTEQDFFAIYDYVAFCNFKVGTVCLGRAYGYAAALLALGNKGNRSMSQSSHAMLHQPRINPTGQWYARELDNHWQETYFRHRETLKVLSHFTGHSAEKLWRDMRHPLLMMPRDAVEYNLADHVIDGKRHIFNIGRYGIWEKMLDSRYVGGGYGTSEREGRDRDVEVGTDGGWE